MQDFARSRMTAQSVEYKQDANQEEKSDIPQRICITTTVDTSVIPSPPKSSVDIDTQSEPYTDLALVTKTQSSYW